MTDLDGFRLSRVYAQGWKAGNDPVSARQRLINPYGSDPERARWNDGFADSRKREET